MDADYTLAEKNQGFLDTGHRFKNRQRLTYVSVCVIYCSAFNWCKETLGVYGNAQSRVIHPVLRVLLAVCGYISFRFE